MINKLKKDKDLIKYILLLFLVSRIYLTIIGIVARLYFSGINPGFYEWNFSQNAFINMWGRWDSGYYLDIAKRGYSDNQKFEFPIDISKNQFGPHQLNLGFFPFYPVLIKGFTLLTGDYFVSAILISNISLLLSAYVLYKLTLKFFDKKIALNSVKFLFLFPSSFILSGAFSEALLLLLILSSAYFAVNKQYIVSGILGGFAALTKLTGILAGLFLLKGLINKERLKTIFGIFFVAISLLGFLLISKEISGNYFMYFNQQRLGWNAKFTFPFAFIPTYILGSQRSPYYNTVFIIIIIFSLLQLFLLIKSFKKLPKDIWFFWLLFFLVSISSNRQIAFSLPRYAAAFFPQFMALALLAKNKRFDFIVSIVFIFTQAFFMAMWVNSLVII